MRRGEVWWCNLDPAVGAEQKKQRPCIIVNDDGRDRASQGGTEFGREAVDKLHKQVLNA